jgi:hypothetical protein
MIGSSTIPSPKKNADATRIGDNQTTDLIGQRSNPSRIQIDYGELSGERAGQILIGST